MLCRILGGALQTRAAGCSVPGGPTAHAGGTRASRACLSGWCFHSASLTPFCNRCRYAVAVSLLLVYAVIVNTIGDEGELTLGWANAGAVIVLDGLTACMFIAGLVASPAFISTVMCVVPSFKVHCG